VSGFLGILYRNNAIQRERGRVRGKERGRERGREKEREGRDRGERERKQICNAIRLQTIEHLMS
jgi:hypothetical protein